MCVCVCVCVCGRARVCVCVCLFVLLGGSEEGDSLLVLDAVLSDGTLCLAVSLKHYSLTP